MLLATLLLAPSASAQSCDRSSYGTDPAPFASLATSNLQNVAVNTLHENLTEANPYVFEGVGYWPTFWVTNSWCIPGMDSGVCGGANQYLGNAFQTWMAPQTPSDAIGFDWGTQGPSVDITVTLSDGASYVFPIAGQTGFFGYCTGDPSLTVRHVVIESADGGVDNVRWGSLAGAPALEVAPLQVVGGLPTNVGVVHALPGERVYLAASLRTGAGPCPAVFGGQCLDLVNPRYLGSAVADANGYAVIAVPAVPAGLSGLTVHVQAAVRRGVGGADSEVSAVASTVVF